MLKFLSVLLVLITVAFSDDRELSLARGDDHWQQSQAANVQVGIRCAYGTKSHYVVQIVVTDPLGEEFAINQVINGSQDGWIFVYFPEDFNTYLKPGLYTWEGKVQGGITMSGKFKISSTSKDTYCNQVTIISP